MKIFDDFISHIRRKANSQGLLTKLEGRSYVRIAPTDESEVILRGLPRRYKDILVLLLAQNLIPTAMKPDFLLWKSHLVTQRKWSLDQRILFRTFDPEKEILRFHSREIYGNLVPRALKLLGDLKYHKVRLSSVNYPERQRGYTDQGSAAPYDKSARTAAVYSKYEEMNQQIVEDSDYLAELLGPGELQAIEHHLGVRTSFIQDTEGKGISVGTKIPETRPEETEDSYCPKNDKVLDDCSFCPPSLKAMCNRPRSL
jgi:hypothetical protein